MGVFARRLAAFGLDWVVLFAMFVAPQISIMILTGRWFLDQDSWNVLTWTWVLVSVTIPSLAYFTVCDRSIRGRTVGKHLMGVSVRSTVGSELSWSRSIGRNLVKLIPWEATHVMIFFPEPFGDDTLSSGKIVLMTAANVLLVVWLLVPLLDRPRYRALHDRVAGTEVTGARPNHRRESALGAM